jgi:hypothetical protein
MDLGQEITNHLEWIEDIASLLGNEEFSEQDLQTISQHDNCALGKWLDSDESQEFKDLPEFEQLVESHDAFHKLAGDLIAALQQGKEEEVIVSQDQFLEMSQSVIGHLQVLQESSSKEQGEKDSE